MNIFYKRGFTLAEVLITLGVIGVIAAITMPNLIKHYQQKVMIDRLKSVYSIISQAVKLSEIDNGPVTDWDISTNSSTMKYFKSYLKNIKECKTRKECLGGSSTEQTNGLILSNGVIMILVAYRNNIQLTVYTNGKKSKKTGKDIFTIIVNVGTDNTYIAKNQSVGSVHFFGQGNDYNFLKSNSTYGCNKNANRSFCGAWLMMNGWKIPKDYPW